MPNTVIPPSVIDSRIVDNCLASGAKTAGIGSSATKTTEAGLTLTCSPDGNNFSASTWWLAGANPIAVIKAYEFFPGAEGTDVSVSFKLVADAAVFIPNTPYTAWDDGKPAITNSTITILNTTGQDKVVKELKAFQFCFRWGLGCVKNCAMCKLYLHILPIPLASLEGLSDSMSPALKVVSSAISSLMWVTAPNPQYGMLGPMPAIHDLRAATAVDSGTLPSSWELKSYVRGLCVNTTVNASLKPEEIKALISNNGKSCRETVKPIAWKQLDPETPATTAPATTATAATTATTPPTTPPAATSAATGGPQGQFWRCVFFPFLGDPLSIG